MEIDFDKPEYSNIISLSKKRIEYGKCKHIKMTINEGLANITCNKCGKQLDPIWVISRFATEEENLRRRLILESKRFDNISKKLSEKSRTKCKHCNKMTPVNINMRTSEWMGFSDCK